MKFRTIAVMCMGALLAPMAPAHHAGNAFDTTRELTIVGTVKEFKWVNPHTWIYLMVPNEKGKLEEWKLEGHAISVLARAGWSAKVLKPGEKVTVIVTPLRNGANGGRFESVTKADGTTYGWVRHDASLDPCPRA